jgi:glycosyltransferase involved in cell wall biosynthesis
MPMRICRVMNRMPGAANPGSGSVGYHLAVHIPEPCLLIVRRTESPPPLPPHVRLVELPLDDRRTPPRLRRLIFGEGRGRLVAGAAAQAAVLARQVRHHARALAVALPAMRRFRPDLLVCHQLQRLVYGVLGKALAGGKLVVYLHGSAEIDALRRLPVLRWLLRRADRVAVVAPAMIRPLAAYVPRDRIWLSASGVDTDVFRPPSGPRGPQLVTVAHFKWMKGYDHLLEAVARVLPRFPDHRLVIVGDGEERPRIVETIARLGLSERVTLAGILGRTDVVRVLGASRLFVMASLHEGLPRALLEAVACGTPAVVTDACNAEGIIETTGLAVPARDPVALAEAITRMLADAALWQRCSAAGPAVAARYDWRAVAARDHEMYRSLVDSAVGAATASGHRGRNEPQRAGDAGARAGEPAPAAGAPALGSSER